MSPGAFTVLVLLASPFVSSVLQKREAAQQSRAQIGTRAITRAVSAYLLHPSNTQGQFPDFLGELVKPPFCAPPFLKKEDLLDPWGNEFEYAVSDEEGNPVVHVWTVRKVGTKTKVIGNKPPEPKGK